MPQSRKSTPESRVCLFVEARTNCQKLSNLFKGDACISSDRVAAINHFGEGLRVVVSVELGLTWASWRTRSCEQVHFCYQKRSKDIQTVGKPSWHGMFDIQNPGEHDTT